MRGGDGVVILVNKLEEPRDVIVGVISPIFKELTFAHVPGNLPVPKVGDEVTLFYHKDSKRLIANRMRAV